MAMLWLTLIDALISLLENWASCSLDTTCERFDTNRREMNPTSFCPLVFPAWR